MKKLLIILGITSIAASLFIYYKEQVRLLGQYKLDVLGIKMISFSFESMTLSVKFKITSYTNIEATVGDVNLDIYVNGTYVGNAYQANKLVIPAMGFNLIDVNIKIINNQIISNIFDIAVAPETTPIEIRIDGTTNIKSGLVGINVPVQNTYVTTLAELLKGI